MYSYEDRIRAVELYIKLDKRVRSTIRQLGYPTKNALKVPRVSAAPRPTRPFLGSSCRLVARAQVCGATLALRQNQRRLGSGGRLAARAAASRGYDDSRRLNTGTLPARATWICPPRRAFSWSLLQPTETEAERCALRRPLFRLFVARPGVELIDHAMQ